MSFSLAEFFSPVSDTLVVKGTGCSFAHSKAGERVCKAGTLQLCGDGICLLREACKVPIESSVLYLQSANLRKSVPSQSPKLVI